MKKLFLLFLTIIVFLPVVSGMAIPPDHVNIYLDGELLEDFDLKISVCDRYLIVANITKEEAYDEGYLHLFEINENLRCWWAIENFTACTSNTCNLHRFENGSRLLLEAGSVKILTEPVEKNTSNRITGSIYDVFISSNGSVEADYLGDRERRGMNFLPLLSLALFMLVLSSIAFLFLYLLIITVICLLFFKYKRIPYTKIYWPIIIGTVMLIVFTPIISIFSGSIIVSAFIVGIMFFLQGMFFHLAMKKYLDWKNSLLLSLLVIIAMATPGILFGLLL